MEEEQDMQDDQRLVQSARRKLRQELRDAVQDTHRHRDEITLARELVRRVKNADELFKKVVAPREAVIDSEHLKLLSEIAREQAQSARGELVTFDTVEYSEKLVTEMGGRGDQGDLLHLDWVSLGRKAMSAFRSTPRVNFVYGALEVVPVRQRDRRTVVREKVDKTLAAEKPKELQGFEEEEEESTTRDVVHMLTTLKSACQGGGHVHYFKFLVDPDSFAHTVENFFHFSFLVKEGRAGTEIAPDGQPYIFLPTNVDSAGQSTRPSKNQVIISFSMRDWERAKQKYHLDTAYIERRKS